MARDHQAILKALGNTLQEGAAALAEESLHSPAAALRAVAAADRALAGVPGFLRALAQLAQLGEPGDYVTAELRRYADSLQEMTRETAPYRHQLDTLLSAEKELRAAADRREEILAKIAELRRVEVLAASTAELHAQREVLESRADVVARAAADATVGVTLASEELISISGGVLEAIDGEIRETLQQAVGQDQLLQAKLAERKTTAAKVVGDLARLRERLAAAESEAAVAEAELEQVQEKTSARLSALTRFAAANRAISAALATADGELGPAGGTVPGTAADLDEAERRLGAADSALAEALAERERLRQAAPSILHPDIPAGPASPEET